MQIKAVYNSSTNLTKSYILNLMTESNKEQIQTKKSFKIKSLDLLDCNFNKKNIFSNSYV